MRARTLPVQRSPLSMTGIPSPPLLPFSLAPVPHSHLYRPIRSGLSFSLSILRRIPCAGLPLSSPQSLPHFLPQFLLPPGHTYPVHALATETAAGGNAHVLLSASADGRVCRWDLSRLSEPLDVASVSDVPGDGPVVGKREESQPQQPQDVSIMAVVLQKDENWQAHGSLITALSLHPSTRTSSLSSSKFRRSSLSSLLLSSSLDCTIKLWCEHGEGGGEGRKRMGKEEGKERDLHEGRLVNLPGHTHRPPKPLVSSFTHGANAYDYVNDVACD
ncbi:hypothetical protein NGA_0166200 [Nannochloropsis gaditana CCMP526]|uniref:uncharacterized protein n=1 Tax=Nannochloropsis gaditana (strain CCMP526) TaxID=1093141 RepID=UPI00029F603E|nr:hypothetical protein NGA_0166200 [Nannochloropsis gaditana CCMP526]EKU22225.1 hypothetical protein NGA_0166200 [Nannochloropsis gaditana CCMP526]|eukprot:XP_005854138.1 hypothetical protein NGA_0166200 [Nannochloropsis gaditana CCMP526]